MTGRSEDAWEGIPNSPSVLISVAIGLFGMILMKKTKKEEQDAFPVPLYLLVAKHFS
jgi:hypothetical protein